MKMADREKRSGRRLKFNVTADIIAEATRENSSNCMIAVALKRAIPDAQAVSVDLATIRYTDKERRERYIYLTPTRAQNALLDYDAGLVPEPFTVAANVMQIVPINHGRAAKKPDATTPAKRGRPKGSKDKRPRKSAAVPLVPNGRAPGEVIRVGGRVPPVGALASGTVAQAALKTGRARRHGIRQMGTRAINEAGA
jgi:hypothetical protein